MLSHKPDLTLLIFLLFSFSTSHLRLFSMHCSLLLPSWDLVSSPSGPQDGQWMWSILRLSRCGCSLLSAAHQALIVLHPLDAVPPFVSRQFLLSLRTSPVHCCVPPLCNVVSFPRFSYSPVSLELTLSPFISFQWGTLWAGPIAVACTLVRY